MIAIKGKIKFTNYLSIMIDKLKKYMDTCDEIESANTQILDIKSK